MRSTTFALTALASLSAASAENVFFTAKSSDNSVNGPISSIHEGAGINYFLVATGAAGSGEVYDLENGVATNKQGNFPANFGVLGSYLASGPAISPSTLKFNGDVIDSYNFWACKNTNDPYSYSANSPIIAVNSKDNSTAPFGQCTPVTISKSAVSSASSYVPAVPASSSAVTSAHKGWTNGTTVTTDITVTGYTTYCPESTVVTITTCSEHKCAPTTVTVTEATTLTVTGECVVPTTFTSIPTTMTSIPTISTHLSSAAASSSSTRSHTSAPGSTHSPTASVTISQGGAEKAVVGAAGLIAGALALLI